MKKEQTYEEEQTPLHYAAKKGNEKAVMILINTFEAEKDKKDYLEKKDFQGRTALYLAAEYGMIIFLKIFQFIKYILIISIK